MPLTNLELSQLPDCQLTLRQFSRIHPELTCRDHYFAVKEALELGQQVYKNYIEEYPSLKNVKQRRKRRD